MHIYLVTLLIFSSLSIVLELILLGGGYYPRVVKKSITDANICIAIQMLNIFFIACVLIK